MIRELQVWIPGWCCVLEQDTSPNARATAVRVSERCWFSLLLVYPRAAVATVVAFHHKVCSEWIKCCALRKFPRRIIKPFTSVSHNYKNKDYVPDVFVWLWLMLFVSKVRLSLWRTWIILPQELDLKLMNSLKDGRKSPRKALQTEHVSLSFFKNI